MNAMATKPKAATITVYASDESEFTHELASDKDWAIIFDDVLEVKGKDFVAYYPLVYVNRWTVK